MWQCSVDTGGTFTDCILQAPDGRQWRTKVLSTGMLRARVLNGGEYGRLQLATPELPGPADWLLGKHIRLADGRQGSISAVDGEGWITTNLRGSLAGGGLLEIASGLEAPVLGLRILLSHADVNIAEVAMRIGTTRSTNALLEGQTAPTALFVSRGFKDLLRIGDQKRPDLFARRIVKPAPLTEWVYEVDGRLDADGNEMEALNETAVQKAAADALQSGCKVAAVCLLHAWRKGDHEERVAAILRQRGFERICVSSQIRPHVHYLQRATTTLVNASLSPVMDDYLDRIEAECSRVAPLVMSSSGGLVPRRRFHAVDSLVSGPAGGLAGAVAAACSVGWRRMIALDMGGTSTDVSRWNNGFDLRKEVQVGPARLLLPALPIETVAAGGGSICHVVDNRLQVGPRSAGADPGPAAYGNGGPLTLTDVTLVLGRLDPQAFRIPLDVAAAHAALDVVTAQLGESDRIKVAEGCLQLAAESMAAAIAQVSLREGADPADYGMVAFGGAGGLQACEVASRLGIAKVLLPADAGLLSAAGIRAAAREVVTSRQLVMQADNAERLLPQLFEELGQQATGQLDRDGVPLHLHAPANCRVHVRLCGQEHSIALHWPLSNGIVADFRDKFTTLFGFWPDSVDLEVVQLDLVLSEKVDGLPTELFCADNVIAPPLRYQDAWFAAQKSKLPVYDRDQLHPGASIHGPALVYDAYSSCTVAPGWRAVLGDRMSLLMTPVGKETHARAATLSRSIRSSLVCNRLEAMVEAMGEQLRRSALSTNIRERLDFSCALLDAEGRLLVNAPHIPVHLGALGLCVRSCRTLLELRPGDVVVTNHPAHGGSHLPDVTVFSGIFDAAGSLLGYLANRAHHAEIGGKAPGSMPADGKCLADEGVVIPPMYLLRKEARNGFGVVENLLRAGQWPSRQPEHNLADLAAQVASLRHGEAAFAAMLDEVGTADIRHSMVLLSANSRDAGKAALGKVRDGNGRTALDDGSVIEVALRRHGERLQVDFSGCAPVHRGNLNATPAIVRSAVLYFVRLLVDQPMPLGEALLDAVDIILPEGMLNPPFDLNPEASPAVVGGNVETSQKITEALLQVAGLLAASQGTMNNLLFGSASFGYYETIGGGAGAGDGFHGASGVHVHMTNTAITDPEILELRYPVFCREFSLRKGSGGAGYWNGGDGLVREIAFRQAVTVSLLTQSRKQEPAGLNGGGNGKAGRNFKIDTSGVPMPLPGICQLQLQAGEAIRLETPGGGAYGKMP